LLGGIAGALGGWWTGRAVAEAAGTLTHEDERHYRAHFDASPNRPVDRAFDDVRGAYYLGQIASHNPNFLERQFTEVEPELERGWAQHADANGSWSSVRHYVAEGFTHGRLTDTSRKSRAQSHSAAARQGGR
jgi:hypothetical protein